MIVVRKYEVELSEEDEKVIQKNEWPTGELISLLTHLYDLGDLAQVYLVKWIRRSLGQDPEIGTLEWIDVDSFAGSYHEVLYDVLDYSVREIGWEIVD